MRKRFVICLNPFESHFLPTLSLANHLEKNNHFVIYMGFSNMEEVVKNEGFNFIPLSSCTDKDMINLSKIKSYKELATLYKQLHEEITDKLNTFGAENVLIGISRYQIYMIPALLCKANIYLYSLCAGSPWFSKDSPPITSNFIYSLKPYQRIINLSLWFKRFLRKGINPHIVWARRFYPWTTMRRLCRKQNVDWKFGIDGFFPSFPVLTLGTKHLEYSDIHEVKFMGLCITEDRKYKYSDIIRKSDNPLIYFSLGTMNERYRKAKLLYSTIIELFKTTPEWNLVLGLGNCKDINKNDIPDNITMYDVAPQLSIIKKADLVITHGGYGTVKECIKYSVPMLVLPCSYDQRGNAARVHFHQIGIMSQLLKTTIFEKKFGLNTKNITPENLRILIEELLYNSKYKKNINNLRQKIETDNELYALNKLFEKKQKIQEGNQHGYDSTDL